MSPEHNRELDVVDLGSETGPAIAKILERVSAELTELEQVVRPGKAVIFRIERIGGQGGFLLRIDKPSRG